MIWKNAEFHNVGELKENEDGSVSWLRMPQWVKDGLDSEGRSLGHATGVEIRFVLNGDKAIIKMSAGDTPTCSGMFHVYRGAIQGGWQDHSVHRFVGGTPEEFEIVRANNLDKLNFMTEKAGYSWDPQVIRVIFDRGFFKIYDIVGDIKPPVEGQKPKKTLVCYGSSITHGSNSMNMSYSWASLVGHNLNMDVRNLGMAGSCRLEPSVAEYLAREGRQGNWDIAVLELGINVLGWAEEKIYRSSENMVKTVALSNPDKPVLVISPFCFYEDDLKSNDNGHKWRRILKDVVEKLALPNVTYINGLDVIGNSSLYISADGVHPSIYGCMKIAEVLTDKIKQNQLFKEDSK